MFTYNLHWEAEKSLLLYPKVNQEDTKFGKFHYNGLEKKCKLGFFELLDNAVLIDAIIIGKSIFQKLI